MNAIWILIVAGLLLLLQMLVFRRAGLGGVTVRRHFTKARLFAGETLEMVETIENRRLLPVPWLKVETRMPDSFLFGRQENLEIGGQRYHSSLFFLGPWRRVRRTHQVRAVRRGYYPFASVTLTVGDLFGFATSSRVQPLQESVTVYPALLSRAEAALPASRWQGERTVRRFIQPDPFLYNGIREYRPGDSVRDVHWRAYARTGELKIKQHDYTAASKLLVLLNIAPEERLWGEIGTENYERLERAVSLAVSLCCYALEDGLDAGLGSNADLTQFEDDTLYLAPASGPQQRERILEAAARLRFHRVLNFHNYLETMPLPSDTDILLLSAYDSPLIREQVQRLQGFGNTVSYYPFPA